MMTLSAYSTSQTRQYDNPNHIRDLRFMDWGGKKGIPGWAHAVLEDDAGLIWLSTSDGLVRFDGVRFILMAPTNEKYSEFRRIFEIEGQIYLGDHDKPLHRYNRDTVPGLIEKVDWLNDLEGELNIWNSYTHHDGRILLSDHKGLIYEYHSESNDVSLLFRMPVDVGEMRGLSHTARAISADPINPDMIWACSKHGLFHINIVSGSYLFYRPDTKSNLESLSTDQSFAFHDHIQIGDDIWISSYGNGLVRYSINQDAWSSYRYEPPYEGISEDANFILSHHSFQDRYILIGARDLKLFSIDDKEFIDFNRHHGGYNAGSIPTVQMYSTGLDDIYFITGGIMSFYSKYHNQFLTGDLKRYNPNIDGKSIIGIKRLSKHKILIEDDSHQVYLWDNDKLSIKQSNEKIELENEDSDLNSWRIQDDIIFIYQKGTDNGPIEIPYQKDFIGLRSVTVDRSGYVWMASESGVIKYDVYHKSYQLFSKVQGLLTNDWSEDGILLELEKGVMFASVGTKFALFRADELFDYSERIYPYVYKIDVYDQIKLFSNDIDEKVNCILEADENYFTIYYSAVDGDNSRSLEFQYKLEGFDKMWLSGRSDKIASYTNVSPGDYVFQVRCRHKGGPWILSKQDVAISVSASFTESLLFKILIGLGAGCFLFLLFRFRIGSIRKEEQLKSIFREELAEVKLEALRSQMNPHFLFNSLNSIDNYILSNNPREASEYLSKFSKLVRKILEFSKIKTVSLKDELDTLKHYIQMEQMRFRQKFEYDINIDETIETEKLFVPPLLLQPYVENAIWHGMMHIEDRIGLLSIKVSRSNEYIIVVIEDNGIGREKSRSIKSKSATKRKSYGIKINEDRIRLNNELSQLGGSVEILDRIDHHRQTCGTKVIVTLPVAE